MAGGKETPRQKLINLMYLVLLAMLALQVSSTIIQKFQFLNDSLESNNTKQRESNDEIIDRIKTAVEKNKNSKDDKAILDEALAFRSQTNELLDYIDDIKSELIERTGGDKDETGIYPGAKEEEPVAQYMIGAGGSKNGEAYVLQQKLNSFINFTNEFCQEKDVERIFGKMALDGKEHPFFINDENNKNKDFAHLNFESTPLVAALAVLTEKESKLMNIESEVLNQLAMKIGAVNIPVDKIRPVVASSSKYVVAGTEYNAQMFMAAYSSNFIPEMTFKGSDLDVDSVGVGNINFRAGSSSYDANGLSKQTWTGTIAFPKADGSDSLYTISQDYYVVKPAIQVQSQALVQLYRNCGNELSIQVPALGADYQPTFSITGGRLIAGNSGNVTVIPTAREVVITIKNNGVVIGNRTFKVKKVPQATFKTNLNQKTGSTSSALRRVSVKAVPPAEFSSMLPNEDSYKITSFTATLVRAGRMKEQVTLSGGSNINLGAVASSAQSGDVVVIEVNTVQRRNYLGEYETASVSNPIITIPIK